MMMNRLRNGIDMRRRWPKALGLLIALGSAQPVHAAQALLVCTVVQTQTPDNTNTAVKILNNCCATVAQGTRISVTVGQKGVAPQSVTWTLAKPLMRHRTTVIGFYVNVPKAAWCSAYFS